MSSCKAEPTRGRCPRCRAMIRTTIAGVLRKHRRMAERGGYRPCLGSGKPPVDEYAHALRKADGQALLVPTKVEGHERPLWAWGSGEPRYPSKVVDRLRADGIVAPSDPVPKDGTRPSFNPFTRPLACFDLCRHGLTRAGLAAHLRETGALR